MIAMNVILEVRHDGVRVRLVHPKVFSLLKRCEHLPEQRTKEWFDQRNSMVTASEVAAVLGVSKFQSRRAVLKSKVGAILQLEEVGGKYTDSVITQWGNRHEDMVRDRFCDEYNQVVHEVGCVPHSTISILGASPDGVLDSGALVEIKCPYKRKITGEIPVQYWHQMQLQMEVCDLDLCYYVEWAPAMDFFDPTKDVFSVQKVVRDTTWLEEYLPTIDSFWAEVQRYVMNPNLALSDLRTIKRRKLEKNKIEFI